MGFVCLVDMNIKPENELPIPELSSIWQHKRGAYYKVVLIANKHSEIPGRYPVTVVYQSRDGDVRTMPLDKWLSCMKPFIGQPQL
jgi:hypothetical protein